MRKVWVRGEGDSSSSLKEVEKMVPVGVVGERRLFVTGFGGGGKCMIRVVW